MGLYKNIFRHNEAIELESGATLPSVEIVYHCSVEPIDIAEQEAQGRRVVWICHALTANSDPSEWWSDLVGKDKLFDTKRDIIICANTLGSCYGSTCASNWNGGLFEFPLFSVRDVVACHILLRKHLQINNIDILAGASVGGFQSLEWSIMEPNIISRLVLIACNERISPWATALNESQRLAIEADSTFYEHKSIEGGKRGLKAARTIAMLSYRSADGYNATQSEEDDNCLEARRASTYQSYQGQKLADRFDAYAYYSMTRMLDTHNVGRKRGGVVRALATIKARTMVIAIDSDILFPECELRNLASLIPNAEFQTITSSFGHDGFLIEWQAIGSILRRVLTSP